MISDFISPIFRSGLIDRVNRVFSVDAQGLPHLELFLIGQTIGHYNILSRLGAGGMGEVFLAEDTKLDRRVALKFLPESLWNDPEAKQRLILEAKAASKLDHPSIVTIHGIEESDGRPFIVMAHVNGVALDRYIASKRVSVEGVINLTMQITDGLQHAHQAGVVHRDLKPGNILVDETDRVRILDFGLARMRGTNRLTQAGSVMGTIAYSPPELIQGKDAEPTSDIYSLGVVLYQVLTGHLPFESDHEAALLYSILQDEPRPMSHYDSAIPANLQAVIMRCLQKLPEDRFANCAALTDGLKSNRSIWVSDPRIQAAAYSPSIAVLPFVNRSASVDDEYFSDGLADELLNMLAKIRGLRVAARTSSFQFKARNEVLAVIGQKLNVATLLDGSVRRSGNRVRISVELVRAADGVHLWSETYDRTIEDIFAVQDDIAQSVVQELRSTLLGEEHDSDKSRALKDEVAKTAMGRAQNAEAHRLYLQGQFLIDRGSREETARGIDYLKQALEIDPGFALGWAKLGRATGISAFRAWVPLAEGFNRARDAVTRSLALEPNLAEGHAELGWIRKTYDWDWRGSDESYRMALELAPGSVPGLIKGGWLALGKGHLQEAVGLARRAVEQDPLSGQSYSNLAFLLEAVGLLDEAIVALQKSLELAPQRAALHASLALMMLEQGRNEEAWAEVMKEADEGYRLWAMAIVCHRMGKNHESEEALRELIEKYAEDSACQIAQVHAARNEPDDAFVWLEKSYTQRDPGLAESKRIRFLRPLHADPRWPVFLKKMGLAE